MRAVMGMGVRDTREGVRARLDKVNDRHGSLGTRGSSGMQGRVLELDEVDGGNNA
jgi:hypothetical protein